MIYSTESDHKESKQGTLEHFLTERYCLFSQDRKTNLYCGEIHHLPWKISPCDVEIKDNSMLDSMGINLSKTPDLAHYSPGVDVAVWSLRYIY